MKDWIFSNYSAFGERIVQPWGIAHIITLLLAIASIICMAIFFRNKEENFKRNILKCIAIIILLFGIARRIIRLISMTNFSLNSFLNIMLPRPWCAISCCVFIVTVFVDKKFMYNISAMFGFICTLIFFAYPGVGFNKDFWVFEDLYSVATHFLLLVGSLSMITLKFTDFRYNTIWKEGIFYVITLIYSAFLIIFKIEGDPLYYMPNNDIMKILNINYGVYLVIYILFMLLYFNIFYIINDKENIKKFFKSLKNKSSNKNVTD